MQHRLRRTCEAARIFQYLGAGSDSPLPAGVLEPYEAFERSLAASRRWMPRSMACALRVTRGTPGHRRLPPPERAHSVRLRPGGDRTRRDRSEGCGSGGRSCAGCMTAPTATVWSATRTAAALPPTTRTCQNAGHRAYGPFVLDRQQSLAGKPGGAGRRRKPPAVARTTRSRRTPSTGGWRCGCCVGKGRQSWQ